MTARFDNCRFAVGLFPAGMSKSERRKHLAQRRRAGRIARNGREVSGVCGGGKFTYATKPYQYPKHTSHAESRMLEDLFEAYPSGGRNKSSRSIGPLTPRKNAAPSVFPLRGTAVRGREMH